MWTLRVRSASSPTAGAFLLLLLLLPLLLWWLSIGRGAGQVFDQKVEHKCGLGLHDRWLPKHRAQSCSITRSWLNCRAR